MEAPRGYPRYLWGRLRCWLHVYLLHLFEPDHIGEVVLTENNIIVYCHCGRTFFRWRIDVIQIPPRYN